MLERIAHTLSFKNRLSYLIYISFFVTTWFLFLSSRNKRASSSSSISLQIRRKPKMPLKIVDATLSNFDHVFQKFRSESQNHRANLILFLADKDPATSLSWCPDCVRAEPVIYKKLEETSGDVALLRAYVGDRPTWWNPMNPLRVDSKFKLTGVPTLVRWENDAVSGRLEDYEAHIEKKIEALVLEK